MSIKRIFISVANDEHKTFRAQLRDLLTRTKFFEVEVQPDFPHPTPDTVRKLDTLIAPCDLLIHIVGRAPGSRANGEAVLDFFEHTPQATFLSNQTKARTVLGDFSQLTYFQWEPWLALHRGIDVLVYGEPDHAAKDHPQRGHLDALYIARKHAEPLLPEETRCAQIVADVCQRFGIMSKSEPRIARTRLISRHTAADFVGREKELALLDDAWNPPPTKNQEQGTTNILSIIAWGGVGKTALLAYWVLSSFIAKNWLNAEGQPDPMAYFDWTFYDQGTRSADATHAGAASVGSFFQKALEHFGDPEPENPEKKVPRLAKRIQAQRSLLILDGLEPLQYPPNHPQAGQLTDPDLRELLGLLAQRNPGLCLISSRQILTDLPSADTSPTRQHDLEELPLECAVSLLRKMQIIGTDEELQQAATDYFCHALSLIVLGRFIFVKGGDIRIRKEIPLERANENRNQRITRNAWHVLEAYEQWLASPQGNAADAQALRLTGLFDRPASADCLAALRRAPAIPGLTDALVPLSDDAWNAVLLRLHEAHLIQLRFPPVAEGSFAPRPEPHQVPLDAHPLIREYFAKQLREKQANGFKATQSRLFDHLCATTEHQPATIERLQPLYQAVIHGCFAERHEEARHEVYRERILRGNGPDGFYSTRKLGAFGDDLCALRSFFGGDLIEVTGGLTESNRQWVLLQTVIRLRGLGRIADALELSAQPLFDRSDEPALAATCHSHRSEILGLAGHLIDATALSKSAVQLADDSEHPSWPYIARSVNGLALSMSGLVSDADVLFRDAERLQILRDKLRGKNWDILYSLPGSRYCDHLLVSSERAAWKAVMSLPFQSEKNDCLETINEVKGRVQKFFNWRSPQDSEQSIAYDNLIAAKVYLYEGLSSHSVTEQVKSKISMYLEQARSSFRKAGQLDELPRALLTAALHHHLLGDPAAARACLAEAQQIAERGPMPLFLADVHLHRARLVRDKAELAKARILIEKHGYGRRREELADAEAASANW